MKKSLISAIKKLLAKLGAEEVEGNNLVEVIDNGADAIEGGSSGGSNAPLILEFATTNPYTVATPLSEIKAAIDTGRDVRFLTPNGLVIWLDSYKENAAGIQMLFFSGKGGTVEYNIDNNGWSYTGK